MPNLANRNQNPGNLRDPATGAFRQFANPAEGKAALYNDLTTKMTGKSKTGLTPDSSLLDFSKTYAPAADDNDPVQYAANLANQLKVSPDTKIGSLTPRIDDFAKAVAQNEGFQEEETAPDQPIPTAATPAKRDWLNDPTGPFGLSNKDLLKAGGAVAATAGAVATGGATGLLPWLGGVIAGKGAINLSESLLAGKEGYDIAKGIISPEKPTPPGPTIPGAVQAPKTSFLDDIQQSYQTSNKAADAITQSMLATATGRVAMQDPLIKEAANAMGVYGLVPEIGDDNSMDFTGAEKKRKSALSDLDDEVSKMLDAGGEQGSIDDAVQLAKASVRKYAPSHEWDEADSHIDKAAATYKKNFGGGKAMTSLGNLQRMKKELSYGQKFGIMDTSAKKNAYKALSQGARGVIESTTQHKDLYNAVMKEEQRLINAKKIMKRLNGKKAKENFKISRQLSHLTAKTISTFVGDKLGGALGAVVGGLVGDTLAQAIDKRQGKTIYETKPMRAALSQLRKKSPKVFTVLMEKLKEAGLKIEVPNDSQPPLIPTKYLKKRDERLAKEKRKGALVKRTGGMPRKYVKARDQRLKKELKKGQRLIS